MEMSHRSKDFAKIAETTRSDLRTLMSVPETHEIMFFQGGASQQFSAICQNFLGEGVVQAANYVTTGTWSEGAVKEAKKFCDAQEVTNNKATKYSTVAPHAEWNVKQEATFFHFCQNETIQGFEFHEFPWAAIPAGQKVVCDMSSNFASREVDWEKFDIVYVGAQKNIGPAGLTIVILKKDVLSLEPRKDIVATSNYSLFSKAANMFQNTPSCWAIYMAGLNIKYMLEQGGLPKMKELAIKRSDMLYEYIDGSEGFYKNVVEKQYRSRMNLPFLVKESDDLAKKFVADARELNLIELSGHRSVGGCRASLYNAMTVEGVEALIAFMKVFKEQNM